MQSQSLLDSPFKLEIANQLTGSKRNLLIVDDEEGPRQSLRIVFKDDYNILLAESGPEAIEIARQHQIDAAVLDIRLYGMSGIELLERLKAIDPATEVVMLTAYETLETARQALRLGACDYLNKPFDISTMRTAVAIAMERRVLSEEIRLSNQKLEKLKAEIQNQQLQQEIIRMRGEIYASIIHDINGPLTVIAGFIEMINEQVADASQLAGTDLARLKNHLSHITRQVNRCSEISRRYLRFLRERPSEDACVFINQILEDLGQLLSAHPSARKNQLVIKPMESDAQVKMNGTELIQVLLNLAINALQCSTEPHRVDVLCRRLSEPLALSAFVEGPEDRFINLDEFKNNLPLLAIVVSDNGPGIEPDVIGKLFDAYFTTKSVGEGTGLGLSIVARLIKQAHGAIHLHTKVGHGTTFTIYLHAL